MPDVADNLVRLGLNKNEAKVLETLFSLGPLGATDINRHSGVPRNKIYEILDKLSRTGIVEVQPGRPVLYRASEPKTVVENIVDGYRKAGEEVKDFLLKLQSSPAIEEDPAAYAWIVRGKEAVKRKLAELVYSASSDLFMVGGFPNQYLDHVISAIKAAGQRGVHTRAVCVVNPMDTLRDDITNRTVIEYRTPKGPSGGGQLDQHDMKMIEGFRETAKHGCVTIVDERVAYNVVDESPQQERVSGILIKAPGAPRIQKGTIEKILGLYTRKI